MLLFGNFCKIQTNYSCINSFGNKNQRIPLFPENIYICSILIGEVNTCKNDAFKSNKQEFFLRILLYIILCGKLVANL